MFEHLLSSSNKQITSLDFCGLKNTLNITILIELLTYILIGRLYIQLHKIRKKKSLSCLTFQIEIKKATVFIDQFLIGISQ